MKDTFIGWPVVLASSSPRRRELLRQIGIDARVLASACDERMDDLPPASFVECLALKKAKNVAARTDGRRLILAADTVVTLDGAIMGKPAGEVSAKEMLRALSGRTHKVYTGVALILADADRQMHRVFSEMTNVSVSPLSEAEICAYVASGEPLDKAGAYGIQGRFAVFIKGIEGDYTNVVGLPLGRLYREAKTLLGEWEDDQINCQ